jgi:hypothetical protein
VYRRKKLDQPSTNQTKKTPVDVIFPKTSNTKRVKLNLDLEGALSKMLITIPLREVIKVPSIKERFDNFFQGSYGPLKDGTIGRVQNVPVTTTYVKNPSDSIIDDEARDRNGPTPHKYSPKDAPFPKEENPNQIKWPKREEYQQLMDELKSQESEIEKILKKVEDDVWIHPSQQEIFIAESHPPPSMQYTRVIQGTTNFRVKEYKEGDVVWMWDANKGMPTNIKGNNHFWFGPFKVGRKPVNDSYYLSTLDGQRHTLLVSEHLLKPHQDGVT